MSLFSSSLAPSKIRILVVRDLDHGSAGRLTQYFVSKDPQFSACIALGPFTSRTDGTPESTALSLGDMSSILAQLETIVCRVIYLASIRDPAEAVYKELHLTPNSVNSHGRWLPLLPGLSIGGYSERSQVSQKKIDELADGLDEEDEGAIVEASNSADIIKELLLASPGAAAGADEKHQSIFLLDTIHAHTLNQFLFFSEKEVSQARLDTCIAPGVGNRDGTAAGAKKKIKKLNLLSPMSLRDGNNFLVLEYESESLADGAISWTQTSSEFYHL